MRLALAVSGGPDSMALALLASRLGHQRKNPEDSKLEHHRDARLVHRGEACPGQGVNARLEARCLVVDHQLREESANEARQVQEWLQERLGSLSIPFSFSVFLKP